ncbi:unnamed protein product [Amoebophrya sp. A120]|nr:unnamed protein product [Amoebophrya sp. A120]|eukprot:GSA120T00007324001.1
MLSRACVASTPQPVGLEGLGRATFPSCGGLCRRHTVADGWRKSRPWRLGRPLLPVRRLLCSAQCSRTRGAAGDAQKRPRTSQDHPRRLLKLERVARLWRGLSVKGERAPAGQQRGALSVRL